MVAMLWRPAGALLALACCCALLLAANAQPEGAPVAAGPLDGGAVPERPRRDAGLPTGDVVDKLEAAENTVPLKGAGRVRAASPRAVGSENRPRWQPVALGNLNRVETIGERQSTCQDWRWRRRP
jgi:hypothetical protein